MLIAAAKSGGRRRAPHRPGSHRGTSELPEPARDDVGRDAGMEVSEGFLIREPFGFRHGPFDELKNAIGSIDEASEGLACIHLSVPLPTLIEPGLSAGCFIRRRQKQQRQKIRALEMSPLLFELGLAFGIDQCRDRIREAALGIGARRIALRLHEHRPTRAQSAQCVVESRCRPDQFGRRCRIQVGPAEARRALEATVLV
jgi:hypothetical protein